MGAGDIYQGLAGGEAAVDFDTHVLASVLAICILETRRGAAASLTEASGLNADQLVDLAQMRLPHLAEEIARTAGSAEPAAAADEACLIELLAQCSADRGRLGVWLSRMIARRAQRPNHLWQDLGLRHRGELNELMRRHFPWLALRNRGDMKWKKFLYRTLCRDLDHGLCAAPSCAECDDFAGCFGEETGDSLLVQARLEGERRA
ncbi:MAG: nitrogen fixation protein NifQ [Pseudomonadota bacterium]|jgi:nitrogen fixation protein NifQ